MGVFFSNKKPAHLVLSDGKVFEGESLGYDGIADGELVFNTGMTGYQEIMTDPSYKKQIVCFTFPMIGNTGWNKLDMESDHIQVSGIVAREISSNYSNWKACHSINEILLSNKIVAISGIDTRELTKLLRDNGFCGACIVSNKQISISNALIRAKKIHKDINSLSLFQDVSVKTPQIYKSKNSRNHKNDSFKIVVLDFGVKLGILESLVELGCTVELIPFNSSYEDLMSRNPDGLLVGNGPGNPESCKAAIVMLKRVIKEAQLPLMGICLGHQLISLSCGLSVYKMNFGHHGINHPVRDTKNNRIFISSQNHCYAVHAFTDNTDIELTYVSEFDNSVQGFKLRYAPVISFQGHPEASPGPLDMKFLFTEFVDIVRAKFNA